MNVVAYCRVSTNKEDQLNSLEGQKKYFEDYVVSKNYNLVKIYADEGISGTSTKKRKQFLQMIEDAKKGLFKMVLVKDISRFARNTGDSIEYYRKLNAYGVEIYFLTLGIIANELVFSIFSAVAQQESENTSSRVKSGKLLNAKNGRVPNIVYGYDKIEGEYFELSINVSETEVVRRIFHMYVEEGFGALKIAQALNKEGIKTKRGCLWSQNAIRRIISNELYIGRIINGKQYVDNFLTGKRKERDSEKWFIVEKPELKVIDEQVFQQAQTILKNRCDAFRINSERQSNKFCFSTLLKCKHCGYSFRRIERTYVNTFVRWVCSGRNAKGTGSCPNCTSIDETDLMVGIKEQLLILLKDKPNFIKRTRKEFERIYDALDNNEKSERELINELEKLKRDKQKYMDMHIADVISMSDLKEYSKPINDRIEQIDNELKLVKHNIGKADVLDDLINNTFKNIETALSVECMTNAMLKKVFQKIVIDESGNVQFFLKIGGQLGLENSVLICNDCTYGSNKKERYLIEVI